MRDAEATRANLLDAAEELVAERGVDGLSLRAVAARAGARNTSAAAYHFGSRDGLLDALFARRMAPINARRVALLHDLGGADTVNLRALVRALVEPLVATLDPTPGSTHYGRFLAAYLATAGADARFTALDVPELEGLHLVTAGLFRTLHHVPEVARVQRVELAARIVVGAVADFERDRDAGRASLVPVSSLGPLLVDALVGLLDAPVGDRTPSDTCPPPSAELAPSHPEEHRS